MGEPAAPTGHLGTIPRVLAAAVDRFGEGTAVVDGELRLTYRELGEAAEVFAGALVAAGVEPGDGVAIWAPNAVEWVVSALGLFSAGAVLIPVNTRFKGAEAGSILRRTSARVLVTVTDFLGTDHVALLRASGIDLPDLGTVVVARGPAAEGSQSWEAFLGRATPEAREEARRRAAAVTRDDPADILFTSGTTGSPKGVVMTHARTLCTATDWVAMTGVRPGDRYLMINPYFHMFGLKAGILASVSAGITMLPEPTFDAARALRRIERERVTVLPAPPTIYQDLLDHPRRADHDLGSLRVGLTAAAQIPPTLVRRMLDELELDVVVTAYGSTEGGTSTSTGPGDDVDIVAGTVGRPRPGFEVRIVEAGGERELPPGSEGELLVRGPGVMSHYLDDPEATAAALSPDGWLRTGDLGLVGRDGNLRIVGRVKDMFIVGGFNAYPAEIEAFLVQHPDVLRAAVVGVPDQRLGEVGAAFVVLRDGAATTPDELVSWSRERMANYKVPRVVVVVDELPVNASGKIMKERLRKRVPGRVLS